MIARSRNALLFFGGMLGGNLAYQISSVAIAWHVYELHRRTFDLGLVGLALFLPTFAFALPAGIAADRFDRKWTTVAFTALEVLGTLGIALAVVRGVTALPVYLAILFFIGTARAFGAPATRSLLPNIVAREDYVRTQATYASLRELVIIGGPAIGGALVALSTTLALGTAAAADGVSLLFIAALRMRPTGGAAGAPPPTLRDALGGLRFLRSRPIVASAIAMDLFAVLFGGATALLPAFADRFHLGAPGLGALRSAPAVGAALVAAYLSRRPPQRRVGATLLIAVAGFGVATIAFAFSRSFALSLVLLALVGGTDMVSVVIRSALVQLGTPDAMRGRVAAVENVFIGASNQLGEFESGVLAALAGLVPSVAIGGIGTLAVVGFFAARVPVLRTADGFPDADARAVAPEASAAATAATMPESVGEVGARGGD